MLRLRRAIGVLVVLTLHGAIFAEDAGTTACTSHAECGCASFCSTYSGSAVCEPCSTTSCTYSVSIDGDCSSCAANNCPPSPPNSPPPSSDDSDDEKWGVSKPSCNAFSLVESEQTSARGDCGVDINFGRYYDGEIGIQATLANICGDPEKARLEIDAFERTDDGNGTDFYRIGTFLCDGSVAGTEVEFPASKFTKRKIGNIASIGFYIITELACKGTVYKFSVDVDVCGTLKVGSEEKMLCAGDLDLPVVSNAVPFTIFSAEVDTAANLCPAKVRNKSVRAPLRIKC